MKRATKNGLASVAAQRFLAFLEPLLAVGEHAAVQQSGAEVPTDLIADAVSGDRREHGDRGDGRQRDFVLVRQDTAEDDRGLAGQHKADEQGGLSEGQPADEGVGRYAVQLQNLVHNEAETAHRGTALRVQPAAVLVTQALGWRDAHAAVPHQLE